MKWRTDKPPKDGTVFLGCWGYPWPSMMAYNSVDDDYSIAIVEAQEYTDGTSDVWFENESCKESEITAWMELPEVKK